MLDDSVSTVYSSIWTSMNSWFTPTILFVLLNVMIATIAFTSSFANQKQTHPKQQQEQEQQPTKLARSPSLLQRIKSINFSNYRSQEHVKDYNFDQTHHQQEEETPFEPPTHYIFEPAPEQTTIEPGTSTQYIFNQENIQKQQTQYDFQQTHQENLQESQTQYLFQHTHEQKPKNVDQDFNFQPNHEQKHENMDQDFNFNPAYEQKNENMNTHFDFKPINEEEEEEEEEGGGGEFKSLDEVYSQLTSERHVSRSRSDTKPYSGEAQVKLPTKMKKSASMKSPFAHFEEEAIVEARRPATTKERSANEDNEVDAKADDFINKFKQQLKLQRLDSILRYKEMIGRGS
ncbi:pathogen-associated molecular patterns-induced protein A70-like [Lycium ferocissimum]|uniref:pathogen-associated molecular patterns-induced protein A70-like n=1 Tax=Lycium ferocissimum TaxID=112874 RepID=UPI002814D335|nr:pathogen-associated molecular patterns-induced protein A70-like [Lycium ferocissimum]